MSKSIRFAFFAYPAVPTDLRSTIESAAQLVSNKNNLLQVDVWPSLDIVGQHIADNVRKKIDRSEFLIADITRSNNNVYYEIGYAIGLGKPILPVVNASLKNSIKDLQSDGFFDNIKYEVYENSLELSDVISKFSGHSLLDAYSKELNLEQPMYVLDTFTKTDFRNALISSVKGSVFFRTFDPVETPRFSTSRIIADATESVGVVIPFLSNAIVDSERHNLRASFLAGIFHGLNRKTLLVQLSESPIPADYREDVVTIKNIEQVMEEIKKFSTEALASIQNIRKTKKYKSGPKSVLQKLNLGASAAENEFRKLETYFLKTAEYNRAARGDGKLVVGRKGSGKTAIFFMIRDKFRSEKINLVLDLKPESHELIKLRTILSQYADAGVVRHTIAGFWEVIVMNEILSKIQDNYQIASKRDQHSLNVVTEIEDAIGRIDAPNRGDFTERLGYFVRNLLEKIVAAASAAGGKIGAEKVTNFIYGPEHKRLRDLILKYGPRGGMILVLFDNLDKGWPAAGVEAKDIDFVRCLVDAMNKMQRELTSDNFEFRFSIFMRNDVYELLVQATSDRGKESEIRIDWADTDKLKLMIGRRLAASLETESSASTLWESVFPEKVLEEDGFDYAIRHSLMRPRFLIDILERSISFGINRGHARVTEEDLTDAVLQHSRYLVNDFGYEVQDISKLTNEIIDSFLGAPQIISLADARLRLSKKIDSDQVDHALSLLFWYGFLGFIKDGDQKYIYDFEYIVRRLKAEMGNIENENLELVINPAFYIGLN